MTTPHELIAKWREEAKDWIDNAQAPEFEIHGERLLACADELAAALAQPQPAPEQTQVNAVYRERSQLVAALSKLFPASLEVDPNEPDWPVCIIDLPTSQVSWHVAPDDLEFFAHLPRNAGRVWDGHNDNLKYERLNALTPRMFEQLIEQWRAEGDRRTAPQPAPDALREALAWYADEANWKEAEIPAHGFDGTPLGYSDWYSNTDQDGGAKARAALGEGE